MVPGKGKEMNHGPGTLFVVGTPIGNLGDLTQRAKEVLLGIDIVVCEDTRRTRKLLSAIGARARLMSCPSYKEEQCADKVLELLLRGRDCAFLSDAGTPNVSDPGRRLIKRAFGLGIKVVPIPGVSAVTALLSCTPFQGDRFLFLGFLPERARDRQRLLRRFERIEEPLVFFEAPHRVRAGLEDVLMVLGDRLIVEGRELTKLHETITFTRVSRLLETHRITRPKGEFTFCVEGARVKEKGPEAEKEVAMERLLRLCLSGKGRVGELSRILSILTGLKKGAIYEMALGIIKEMEH